MSVNVFGVEAVVVGEESATMGVDRRRRYFYDLSGRPTLTLSSEQCK